MKQKQLNYCKKGNVYGMHFVIGTFRKTREGESLF